MNFTTFTRFIAVVLTGFALAGCSKGYPELGEVHGVVTLDGAPYPNARVTFTPAKGRPSEGITDSAGKYELSYLPEVKGAELGEHKVTITTQYQAPENPDGGAPFKDPIPSQYNTESAYQAPVVKGENKYDFAIVTK